MKNKSKISLIICLLTVIFLFAGCRDYSQEVCKEVPQAPPEAPVLSPAPVEEEIPAPPEPFPEDPRDEDPQTVTYILNTNTKKFHKPACRSAGQIKPKNRLDTVETREDVVARGYSPCGNCKP